MDEYSLLHTSDKEQMQFLLRTVKNYRQQYPDRNKLTMMQKLDICSRDVNKDWMLKPRPGPMAELSSVVKALPRTSSYTNKQLIAIYTNYI